MTRQILKLTLPRVVAQAEHETQRRRAVAAQPAMVPLSRLQKVCAKNQTLKAENAELRAVAAALTSHFYLFNDNGRRKLQAMGATMPEDALPILLATGSTATDVFAVIAKLAKDGNE